METLSKDLKRELALKLSPPDLINFCLSNKGLNKEICDSKDFWRQKLIIDYPKVFNYYNDNKLIIINPKNLYIRKSTEVFRMIEKFVKEEFGAEKEREREEIIYNLYQETLKNENMLVSKIKLLRLKFVDEKDFNERLYHLIMKLIRKDQMYEKIEKFNI